MCCGIDLKSLGYKTENQEMFVTTLGVVTSLAAISGVVMGVLGLYGVISQSTSLWSQVGMFGAVAGLGAIAVGSSENVKRKLPVVLATLSLLALPVLFGSLGAVNVIHPHEMLYAATGIFAGVVVISFVFNSCVICTDCIG
jgi:hypothetical protein